MRKAGKAQKTEAPTGARPELDWINFSGRFLSAFICVHLRLKCIIPVTGDCAGNPGRVYYRCRCMKCLFKIAVLALGWSVATMDSQAQTPVPPPAPMYQPLADAQLDQLLGPIALYPDPLIAEILPAATLPTQIVLADRYVGAGGDPGQIDQQPWDPSVQALARYPSVLKWMDDNLNWTTELGQAFLNQETDVIRSLQRLRTSAYNLGNLQSTPQQQVIDDGGEIDIDPVDSSMIYVPFYPPDEVFYEAANGTPLVTFGLGWPIGPWLNGDFDWGNHHLVFWNRDHPRPSDWWRTSPHERNNGYATAWHPDPHRGGVGVNRGDRGWQAAHDEPVVTTIGRSPSDSVIPRRPPEPAVQPEAMVTRSFVPARTEPEPEPVERRPADNVTFIGSENTRATQAASDRGRQSIQATHFRPAASSQKR